MNPEINQLTEQIIGAGIEVHRELGPGLLESAYQSGLVVVELKTVEALIDVHEAQVLTYLKFTGCRLGLLLNFNSATLIKGLRRLVR